MNNNNQIETFLLTSLLKNSVLDFNCSLTPQNIAVINVLINTCPDIFDELNDDIKNIIADNKIDLQDIPSLIHIITKIFNSPVIKSAIINHGINLEPEDIVLYIKYTLDTILTSQFLVIPEIQKTIIKKIIDTSLDLLITNIPSIKKNAVVLSGISHIKNIIMTIYTWIKNVIINVSNKPKTIIK